MDKRLKCEIVKDLLPNYIEGLTSDYTTIAVKEHLENCDPCLKTYEMLSHVDEDVAKRRVEEVKQLKWYMKKVKIINLVLGVVMSCSVLWLGSWMYDRLFIVPNYSIRSAFIEVTEKYALDNGDIYFTINSTEPYFVGAIGTGTSCDKLVEEKCIAYSATVDMHRTVMGQQPKTESGELDVNYDSSASFILDPETGIIEILDSLVSKYEGNKMIDELMDEVVESKKNSEYHNMGAVDALYYEGNNVQDRLLIWEAGMKLPRYPY